MSSSPASGHDLPLPPGDKAIGVDIALRTRLTNLADELIEAVKSTGSHDEAALRVNEQVRQIVGDRRLDISREAVRRWHRHYEEARAARDAEAAA